MTDHERAQIGSTWLILAQMNGKEVQPAALSMMLDAISDLPAQKVINALNDWCAKSKAGRHPFPAELRDMVKPAIDSKALAIDLARKIDKSICDHGATWSHGCWYGEQGPFFEARVNGKTELFGTFKEAVIAELGPIGWNVICTRGGVENVLSAIREMDEGTFIAQLRDQVQSTYQLAEQGVDVTRISLPDKQSGKDHELDNVWKRPELAYDVSRNKL